MKIQINIANTLTSIEKIISFSNELSLYISDIDGIFNEIV